MSKFAALVGSKHAQAECLVGACLCGGCFWLFHSSSNSWNQDALTAPWKKGCRIVFDFFWPQVLEFWLAFFPVTICLGLELEPIILHGICYILAWSLCILHGIWYIWPCSPSILHGMCHILACQPLICMVCATFWCFKRSCESLEGSLSFHVGFHSKFHLGFHLGLLYGFI